MPALAYDPPIRHVGLLASQTLLSLEPRYWFSWRRTTIELQDVLPAFVDAIVAVNPEELSEEQFAQLIQGLSRVIDKLQEYFARHVSSADTSECHVFGSAVAALKDAKKWLAQGLSPNPGKRPTEPERKAAARRRAAEVWSDLIA